MAKYLGFIPLIATAVVEFEAEDENEAYRKLLDLEEDGTVDLMGFDPEPANAWWVEEKDE